MSKNLTFGGVLCGQIKDIGDILDRALDRMREEDVLFVLAMAKMVLLEAMRRKKSKGGLNYAEEKKPGEVRGGDQTIGTRNKDCKAKSREEKSRQEVASITGRNRRGKDD